MDQLTAIVQEINGVLWGVYGLIPLLVGTGIYFTCRLDFVQIRKIPQMLKFSLGDMTLFGKKAGKQGMSSFQSLATAIAAQVGTGNLAGAATAIAMGGPGAIFWMWIAAFFGMATIFAEAVLGQSYKTRDESGGVIGGPAYYISQGLGSRKLAAFFAVAIIFALGFIGNMVQSNSIAGAVNAAFGVPAWLVGVAVAVLAGFVFFGGRSRIAATTEKIVPVMALLYILGGILVILTHLDMFIPAMKMIFVGAFDPQAATGGIIGAGVKEAMRYGVARGLFSNEAGMGSTPHAHAIAKVKHPVEQGYVAIMGVLIDTFVVLNTTALVIFMTGVLDGKTTGIALTQKAFEVGLGSSAIGYGFVAVCLFFFAFSTIIGWYFFAQQNVIYLLGRKVLTPFRVVVMAFIALGAFLKVDLVWELSDLFNGLMVLPNLLALWGLSRLVAHSLAAHEDRAVIHPGEFWNASFPRREIVPSDVHKDLE